MASWAGARSSRHSVSEVRKPLSAKPGMSGTTGSAPVATTMARVVSVAPAISTDQGEVIRAWPSRTSTPSER